MPRYKLVFYLSAREEEFEAKDQDDAEFKADNIFNDIKEDSYYELVELEEQE